MSKQLRILSKRRGPEQKEYERLADRVDEFATSLIDPLKSYDEKSHCFRRSLDCAVDKAIDCEQKKVNFMITIYLFLFYYHDIIVSKFHRSSIFLYKWRKLKAIFVIISTPVNSLSKLNCHYLLIAHNCADHSFIPSNYIKSILSICMGKKLEIYIIFIHA